MIKKTYKAKSALMIRVSLNYGVAASITFVPLTDGSSVFVTTDTTLQNTLENHDKYGKLFVLDGTEEVANAITEPKPSYSDKQSETGNVVTFDPQSLTEQEKAQARRNIGAATEPAELQNVLKYSEQSLSDQEKQQARINIGAQADYATISNQEMDAVLAE